MMLMLYKQNYMAIYCTCFVKKYVKSLPETVAKVVIFFTPEDLLVLYKYCAYKVKGVVYDYNLFSMKMKRKVKKK